MLIPCWAASDMVLVSFEERAAEYGGNRPLDGDMTIN